MAIRIVLALVTLILRYPKMHYPTLTGWQIRILAWHAGQMFAFSNNYEQARIYFLEGINLEKLKFHREVVANNLTADGRRSNLHILEVFVRCFELSYSIANNCN